LNVCSASQNRKYEVDIFMSASSLGDGFFRNKNVFLGMGLGAAAFAITLLLQQSNSASSSTGFWPFSQGEEQAAIIANPAAVSSAVTAHASKAVEASVDAISFEAPAIVAKPIDTIEVIRERHLQTVIAKVGSTDAIVRLAGLLQLGDSEPARAVPLLLQAASIDLDQRNRLMAIRSLLVIGRRTGDPDGQVRNFFQQLAADGNASISRAARAGYDGLSGNSK
jgi:hypothetical protein